MQTEVTKTPATVEMLELARQKAEQLQPGQQIRLGGAEYELSYTIRRYYNGKIYICWDINCGLGKFFKNRPVHQIVDNYFTDETVGLCQRLEKKD